MSWCGHALHPSSDPCSVFTLQGLDFITSGEYDTPYGLENITGWGDGSVGTGGPVPFDTADGGTEGDVYYGPATITFEGDIDARSHDEYAEAVAALKGVLKRPRWDWLVGDESVHLGLSRQVRVARTRPVQVTSLGATYGLFTMQLEAASSVLLDTEQRTLEIVPDGTPLRNIGDTDADLTLALHGPLTNPGFVWYGGGWEYGGTIPAGRRIFVDMARRTVRDPDTTGHSRGQIQDLGAGSWLRLAPGLTTAWRTGSGSGTITASWRSAWS